MEILTSKNDLQPGHTGFDMESMAPNIYVRDMEQTIRFYQFLGFEIVTTVSSADNKLVFVLMKSGSVHFMFQTFESIENSLPAISRNDGGSLLLYINVKGIHSLYEKLKDSVPILNGPQKTFYGTTEFSILDTNNYMITFAEDE